MKKLIEKSEDKFLWWLIPESKRNLLDQKKSRKSYKNSEIV